MPAPALAAAVIRGVSAARSAAAALQEERVLARRVKAMRQAEKVKSELKAKAESVERLVKKLKQLKRIGWLIKGVTLGSSSLGDVFISIWILLFWANMELFIFPLFIPWWKQEWWEKMFTYILDFVVLCLMLFIVVIIFTIVKLVSTQIEGANTVLDILSKDPRFVVPVSLFKGLILR